MRADPARHTRRCTTTGGAWQLVFRNLALASLCATAYAAEEPATEVAEQESVAAAETISIAVPETSPSPCAKCGSPT